MQISLEEELRRILNGRAMRTRISSINSVGEVSTIRKPRLASRLPHPVTNEGRPRPLEGFKLARPYLIRFLLSL